jgi:hypothetical protein
VRTWEAYARSEKLEAQALKLLTLPSKRLNTNKRFSMIFVGLAERTATPSNMKGVAVKALVPSGCIPRQAKIQ